MDTLISHLGRVDLNKTDTDRVNVWESDAWRACNYGNTFAFESDLEMLSPHDKSRFINARDTDGNTPLIIASGAIHAHGGCKQIIELLLRNHADINAQNHIGRTALMEASLWGGLAAVMILLNPLHGSPANVYMKDNLGLRAHDLASNGKKSFEERLKRCDVGENLEYPLDDLCRTRIMNLLQWVRKGGDASTCARKKLISDVFVTTNRSIEDRVVWLEAELVEMQAEKAYLTSQNHAYSAELRKRHTKLDNLKAQHMPEDEELFHLTRNHMDLSNSALPNLHRSAGRSYQYRCEIDPHTKLHKFDFIQTFDFIQSFDITPNYDKATIAHMDMNGKHYLAKNGKHNATAEGFVSGKYYSHEAFKIFEVLDHPVSESYAQHVEAQLMALYIEQFCADADYTIDEFKVIGASMGDLAEWEISNVQISVSRRVCGSCAKLATVANEFARNHGFCFSLVDVSIYSGTRN